MQPPGIRSCTTYCRGREYRSGERQLYYIFILVSNLLCSYMMPSDVTARVLSELSSSFLRYGRRDLFRFFASVQARLTYFRPFQMSAQEIKRSLAVNSMWPHEILDVTAIADPEFGII